MFQLSRDQKLALDKLLDWYKTKNRKSYITLGGFAGTGKTTLISVFRKKITKRYKKGDKIASKLRVAFASYTGKAARILKSKLLKDGSLMPKDSIGTIHSLIYSPIENESGEIIGWQKKDKIYTDLIIIDEASMISKDIWKDLTSYNIPIIAVGDHGQLPPIYGNFNLMKNPHIKLEKIHRQAKNSPIIKLSILAREQGSIPKKSYSKNVKKIDKNDDLAQEEVDKLLSSFTNETLIICGYNTTRVKLNDLVRKSLGFESLTPAIGDRVICLRNNHLKQIYNGMLGNIDWIEKYNNNWYQAKINFDDGEIYSGLISQEQFNRNEPMNFTKDRSKITDGDLFDFGYVLTVHKAQGSQAKRVILFEERFRQMDESMWRRWLYTAITRAQEELYIIGK